MDILPVTTLGFEPSSLFVFLLTKFFYDELLWPNYLIFEMLAQLVPPPVFG